MNKLPFRSVVFSTFLIVVCGAVSHNDVRAGSMAGPATEMDPHMSMTKLRPRQPGDQARADAIVAAAKKAAERYRDYRKAEADGYTIFMPEQRQNVYHFIRESSVLENKEHFDPGQPPACSTRKLMDRPRDTSLLVSCTWRVMVRPRRNSMPASRSRSRNGMCTSTCVFHSSPNNAIGSWVIQPSG